MPCLTSPKTDLVDTRARHCHVPQAPGWNSASDSPARSTSKLALGNQYQWIGHEARHIQGCWGRYYLFSPSAYAGKSMYQELACIHSIILWPIERGDKDKRIGEDKALNGAHHKWHQRSHIVGVSSIVNGRTTTPLSEYIQLKILIFSTHLLLSKLWIDLHSVPSWKKPDEKV